MLGRERTMDAFHYPLPDTIRGSKARSTDFDKLEMDILQQKGAFLLPSRDLCDEIVESFFT